MDSISYDKFDPTKIIFSDSKVDGKYIKYVLLKYMYSDSVIKPLNIVTPKFCISSHGVFTPDPTTPKDEIYDTFRIPIDLKDETNVTFFQSMKKMDGLFQDPAYLSELAKKVNFVIPKKMGEYYANIRYSSADDDAALTQSQRDARKARSEVPYFSVKFNTEYNAGENTDKIYNTQFILFDQDNPKIKKIKVPDSFHQIVKLLPYKACVTCVINLTKFYIMKKNNNCGFTWKVKAIMVPRYESTGNKVYYTPFLEEGDEIDNTPSDDEDSCVAASSKKTSRKNVSDDETPEAKDQSYLQQALSSSEDSSEDESYAKKVLNAKPASPPRNARKKKPSATKTA
ncbi:hypothetical protein nvc2_035 [Namao virus]|nr:hypothetical protein nvc2_035 [Namao virus]